MHLDTTFLIDLLRERRRKSSGPATQRLEELAEVELRVSVHAICELFAGVELAQRRGDELRSVEKLLGALEIVYPSEGFARTYGRILASLQSTGSLIGTMDLLIATAALVEGAPLVTRNVDHFERIDGLDVVSY